MTPPLSDTLSRTIRWFEHAVVLALVAMIMLVIALSLIDLGWLIVEDIITPPIVLVGIDELLEIFGFLLLILIGIELLETIKVYLQTYAIRLDIVLEVALIAIARKIIVIDLADYDGLSVIGIAALVMSLAIANYFARRARVSSRLLSTAGTARSAESDREG